LDEANSAHQGYSETQSFQVLGSHEPIPASVEPLPFVVGGRYQVLGELGRGGMGVVYRAIDNLLGREIAIKVLRNRVSGSSPAAIHRFVDEALVTSQLQHPGIPAIYDLGVLDGQPYLTMKLIKGDTLANRLRDPASPLDPGEFIAVFESACQAVAYAHEHRIVHRDLKPSNIMVGAFGEIQVMDWGLAKKLGPGESARIPSSSCVQEIRTTRSMDTETTMPGCLLGTPAYTSPEQAAGDAERMDERVDVFGLGAVLCNILTGFPPYVAESTDELRRMAIRGELEPAFARLNSCHADRELVELCRNCLAADLQRRPRDARAVAERIAAYRTGVEHRLQAARQATAVALAKTAEQRKRRRMQTALAASLVLLLGGLALGLWWNHERSIARLAEAEIKASLVMNKAEQLATQTKALDIDSLEPLERGEGLCREALAAAEQAEGIVAATQDAELIARIATRADSIRSSLMQFEIAFAHAKRDRLLLLALEKAHGMSADLHRDKTDFQAARAYDEAFEQAGIATRVCPEKLAAAIDAERPVVRAAILTSLDHWAWCLGLDDRAPLIRKTADLLDHDAFRREVRAAIGSRDLAALLKLADRPEVHALPTVTASLLGRALDEQHEYRSAAKILLAARDRNPGDYWLLIELAHTLWQLPPGEKPGQDEAIACLRAALALRPHSGKTYSRLGWWLDCQGDFLGAEFCYRKAIECDSSLAEAWNNLGVNLERRPDASTPFVENCYRTAIRLDPDFPLAYTNLSLLLLRKGELVEAEDALQKAIASDSGNWVAYTNLGVIRERKGDIVGAIAAHELAMQYGTKLALTHWNVGETRRWLADWAGAEACFRKALEAEAGFFPAEKNLGLLLSPRGDLLGANHFLEIALKKQPNDADSLATLGWIRERQGDVVAAARYYEAAAQFAPASEFVPIFQAQRLKLHPTSPGELECILQETLERHPDWSPRQRRAARSAAALTAVWYARPTQTTVPVCDRPRFRMLGQKLFLDLIQELAEAYARSPESTAEELIAVTATWLGWQELAPVRNLFALARLSVDETRGWIEFWGIVNSARAVCLKARN
jgi:tetratricopeptide (TPR) repeat protein